MNSATMRPKICWPSLIAWALIVLGASPCPLSAADISPQDAASRIYDFLHLGGRPAGERADIIASATRAREYNRMIMFGDGRSHEIPAYFFSIPNIGDFDVERSTGLVLSAHVLLDLPKVPLYHEDGSPVPAEQRSAQCAAIATLPQDEAMAHARAYAAVQYPSFAQRKFAEKIILDSMLEEVRYLAIFQEGPSAGETAVFPNEIRVEMHPGTGSVVSYRCSNLRLSSCSVPAISRDVALEKARAAFIPAPIGPEVEVGTTAALQVIPDSERSQGRLVYVITVRIATRQGGSVGVFLVDAETGDLVQ